MFRQTNSLFFFLDVTFLKYRMNEMHPQPFRFTKFFSLKELHGILLFRLTKKLVGRSLIPSLVEEIGRIRTNLNLYVRKTRFLDSS